MVGKKTLENDESLRLDFKRLILQNPNYFGTNPKTKKKAIKPMQGNTRYEELNCIGFNPEQDVLEAIVDVKSSTGYSGGLCSYGSFEYVRFFIDWDDDGDFSEPEEDVGVACVNVHDIPDEDGRCRQQSKPLYYAISVKIDPQRLPCTRPRLVKVRGILQWNAPPPAGEPDHPPVWGNVMECWVQIRPSLLLLKDVLKDLKKIAIDPELLDMEVPISKDKELSMAELEQAYKVLDVPQHRFKFPEYYHVVEMLKKDPGLMVKLKTDPDFANISELLAKMSLEGSDTGYEELRCVGLNYDLDVLVATFSIKRPAGYGGGPCTKGSLEYVAFWAYVWDQIEQMCHWKYMGTSSVRVHDYIDVPSGGLQYAVRLPVDLSSYKDSCGRPTILKVRAILSWNVPPSKNDPNQNPHWGNRVESLLQIKPGHAVEGQVPFISVVGGMAVESISGNALSVIPSALGDGYANGPSVLGGFSAQESPFGGVVTVCGHISNPPDISAGSTRLRYKVQYKKKGDASWHDMTNGFRIWISIWNGMFWSMTHKDQVSVGGEFEFEEDLSPPEQHFVEGNVLAQWYSGGADGDGLYDIRMLLSEPFALGDPLHSVPPGYVSSNIVKVMVDNTPPVVALSVDDLKPCKKYTVGESSFTGRISATDQHIGGYSLTIQHESTPLPVIPPDITPGGESYPLMPTPGVTDKPFTVNIHSGTSIGGYYIRLYAWDRTVVNNGTIGWRTEAIVVLCLQK
jgi:hypothetical protein